MAINEPNTPDNGIPIVPGNQAKTPDKTAPDQPLQDGGEATVKTTEAPEKVTPAEPEKASAPTATEEKAPEPAKQARRGRPPKAEKSEKPGKEPKAPKPQKAGKTEKAKQGAGIGGGSTAKSTEQAEPKQPAAPAPPPVPRDATRNGEKEQIVYLNLSELHAFKNHPFGVRDDSEMRALAESVKNGGVNQPALVRPREDGGYEIIAGHRRQKASEMAGLFNMPCIVRNMTDDEAILAMTDDNLRQRSEILPSEKAQSLKMQVEAIKHQGTRDTSGQNVQNGDAGKLSIDIVGERNDMNPKQVQRYIRLTELVPDLQKAMDEKRLGFTPAVELSFVRPKNQNLIAVSLEGQQAAPSLSQAKRMRELDKEKMLNGDVIDAILCEEKKEVDRVIISGEELGKYFGKEKTPREMKDTILKLLDEYKAKQPPELAAPVKKTDIEK